MLQYEWYKKNDDIKKYSEQGIAFTDIHSLYQIESVRLSMWEEHCLECAPPLCYYNCSNFYEREDKKCRTLYWGIRQYNHVKNPELIGELRFRPWGKIETIGLQPVISLKSAKRLNNINKIFMGLVCSFSKYIRFLSPKMRLYGAIRYFRNKLILALKYKSSYKTQNFLFQAHSYEKDEFGLCFDILTGKSANEKDLIFREKILIKNGENIAMIPLHGSVDFSAEGALARLYPENNITAHLVINFCDFIELSKPEGVDSLPKSAEKVKCVVWDLDNTLWSGILIESDENDLKLRDNVLETIKQLDQRGIIQSIASKNDYENASRVLSRLGVSEYFIYPMMSWDAKSYNLKKIADLLNIDINSFALIDDSIFERKEVSTKYPQVRVYPETDIEQLLGKPEFDFVVTADSANRRHMYKLEESRRKVQQEFESEGKTNLAFLRSCNISISVSTPNDDAAKKRCFELISRTNQLNLSAKKYSYEEFLDSLNDANFDFYIISCSDNFGEYGVVAFLKVGINEDNLVVREFAMSCRVAEKWVDSALLYWLQTKYSTRRLKNLVFEGTQTKRNGLLQRTLKNCGLTDECSEGKIIMRIPMNTPPDNHDIVRENSL